MGFNVIIIALICEISARSIQKQTYIIFRTLATNAHSKKNGLERNEVMPT